MNPKLPPNQSDGDETAISSRTNGAFREAGEATDAGPTDATVIRGTASAPTINEKAGATPDSFGKYELLGEIARGGMGVVYKARQHGLDRIVALKMILGTGLTHETAQRFLQEARAAAALDHPNVVPIYDIGETGDRPYFTMAFIDGPNLRGFTDAQRTLPIATAVSLFAQVVAGVAHAHKHGIIHRDLKPANVLIDKDGRPRVTDFGLAKRATTDSQLTVTGQVVGTPQYMAPEQARDSKDVGPPADVYALGAILYFLLTGRPPFVGESFTDLLLKVVTEAPVSPRQLRPDVPVEIETLCLRCLAKSPADRFADADALAEALVPITDQHLTPSSNLSPSLARIGLSRASTPSLPSLPSTGTVPDLSAPSGPAMTNSVTALLPTSPPKPNRKPLLIGLGAVAVLLLGVIGYLATRDKKDDFAQKEPVPPPTIMTAPNPASSAPTLTPPPPTPIPGKNDGDKLAWPTPTRADFGLKVDLREKKDVDGTFQLTAGKAMKLHLTAEKDCHVFVWLIEPSGRPTQLFPNDDDQDSRLTAGKERIVPSNSKYTLETTVTEGTGAERLRILAVTGKPIKLPRRGTQDGRFPVYAGAEGKELAKTVADISGNRGVIIKKADPSPPGMETPTVPNTTAGEVSETELRFRVSK